MSTLFTIGIRQVASGADIVGYVIVMNVPEAVAAADGSLDSLMGGVAGSYAEVVKGTVGGVDVDYVTKSDIAWGAYLDGNDFVAAFSADPTQAAPILAALVAGVARYSSSSVTRPAPRRRRTSASRSAS